MTVEQLVSAIVNGDNTELGLADFSSSQLEQIRPDDVSEEVFAAIADELEERWS